MSTWGMVRLIAGKELRERAAKKGYVFGTVITLVVVAALIVVPTTLASDGPTEVTVAVVGDAPADLQARLEALSGEDDRWTVVTLGDRPTAERALAEGTANLALVDRAELVAEERIESRHAALIESALQLAAIETNLRAAGLDAGETLSVLTPPPPLQLTTRAGESEDGNLAVAFMVTLLLVLAVQLTGANLLSGALEDKSNRVVEILVSAARPWQLLTGKVVAMSLLGFAQVVLIGVTAAVANATVDAVALPEATAGVVVVSVVMLMVGFVFYASLFAVAGTLANTMEDAQTAATPLTMTMLGAFVLVFLVVLPDPDGAVGTVLTLVPPTAPFVLPARMALGGVAAWEIVAAVGLTIVGALGAMKLAGQLYASSLLAGGKLTWAQAWKSEPVR